MKTPIKYQLQTPLNQRCTDDFQRITARAALGRALSYFRQPAPTQFELERFDREYEQHHAAGHGLRDWRPASIA